MPAPVSALPLPVSTLAFQVYGLHLDHKHTPEIQLQAGLAARPAFVPAYGNFRQGMVLTIVLQLRLLAKATTSDSLRHCLHTHYARQSSQSNIEVLTNDRAASLEHLDPQVLNGSNQLQLGVFGNDLEGQVLLSAVFDNLGKGACGAAIQNLELMLGFNATAP